MSEKTFKQWFSERSKEGITFLVFMSMFAQWLAACSGEASPAIGEVYADGEEIGGPAIHAPTPEATATSETNGTLYPTETYVSERLGVCSMHQFGAEGALTPRMLTQCNVNPDIEDNRLLVTGNLLEISDGGYLSLTDDRGYSNPLEPQMMSVEQLKEWVAMMDLNFTEQSDMARVIAEAENINGEVMVIFKTIYNKGKDANGQERLIDMGLTVGFQPFGGDEVAVLEDRLDPVTRIDVLNDMQVASVDMVPSATNLDQISLEVYPADWVESAEGKFVSPEFIEIQDNIAGGGKRFTLNGADGLIYDGETRIPGMTVAPDGTMTLTVNGETITLDPADVDFDDEAGITIDGYEWDADEEAWVEANGTVTVAGGLKLEIGEPDENGYSEVEEITLPFNLTAEEKAEKEYQMDATTFGFSPDATRLVYDNETDTLKIVSTTDPTNVIAEWGRSDTTGQAEMIYDFSKMVDEKGENVLLSVGWVEEMSGGMAIDSDGAFERSRNLYEEKVEKDFIEIANRDNRGSHSSGVATPYNIFSNNRRNAIQGFLIAFDNADGMALEDVDRTEGVFYFRLAEGNTFGSIVVNNFVANLRTGVVK